MSHYRASLRVHLRECLRALACLATEPRCVFPRVSACVPCHRARVPPKSLALSEQRESSGVRVVHDSNMIHDSKK
eukprot:scaffold316065_cov26-Tisochrysis_lutea.AAC.1